MKKILLLSILFVGTFLMIPAPETHAMEPVTMVALAPVALQVAQVAAPYVIRGLQNLGTGFIDIGVSTLEIFLLPIGFFEVTFLAPWCFYDGLKHLMKGAIAPFKLCFHALILPVRPFGALF